MEKSFKLNDLRIAFLYKKTSELRFTYYIFRLLQHERIAGWLRKVAQLALKYNIPVKSLIRKTIFRVFCAGESLEEAIRKINSLQIFKVHSVLDYVSEAEKNEKAYQENKEIIIRNILRLGKEAPGNSVSIKLTGLEDNEFFRRINNVKAARSTDDEHRYQIVLRKLAAICEAALDNGVTVYLDAEDRYMQDIFDHMAEHLMSRYNTRNAVVFNTLQMYLTDRIDYLKELIARSATEKYFPGIKLVRGAYAEKEREAARLAGTKSPVFDTKEETDRSFNLAVDICLKNSDRVYTCVASHNEESTIYTLNKIEEYKITDHQEKVRFSQLFGMSDKLTFNLAAQGYHVSKYMPYGEVRKAIPYLIRRAEENSSISGQVSREVIQLEKELFRRKHASEFIR
jgi:proline dehydrogenase